MTTEADWWQAYANATEADLRSTETVAAVLRALEADPPEWLTLTRDPRPDGTPWYRVTVTYDGCETGGDGPTITEAIAQALVWAGVAAARRTT